MSNTFCRLSITSSQLLALPKRPFAMTTKCFLFWLSTMQSACCGSSCVVKVKVDVPISAEHTATLRRLWHGRLLTTEQFRLYVSCSWEGNGQGRQWPGISEIIFMSHACSFRKCSQTKPIHTTLTCFSWQYCIKTWTQAHMQGNSNAPN